MKPSVLDKLQSLSERLEEVTALLSTPEATADINRFRQLNQEHAELTPVVEAYRHYRQVQHRQQLHGAGVVQVDDTLREHYEQVAALWRQVFGEEIR